ncbi:MAG TPA: MurR/RpiR family transcriptional regulator [Tianweitania sediminis]|jgi:DNA-binding MurR/RpiR family transcriptional regulator|nr:MurR/RpiR family transcriptional regulator [Tianweitania sediminis]
MTPDTKTELLQRLRDELPELSAREARAARHLLTNYPMAGMRTVAEFANESGVSTATVLRLVKRLGFPVYSDFQSALRRHIEATLQSPLVRFGAQAEQDTPSPEGFFDRFIVAMSDHLETLRRSIVQGEFDAVVELIANPRRDIHLVGGRYSTNLMRYFADLLLAVRGRVSVIDGQTQIWPQNLLDMGKSSVLVITDVRRYQQDVIEFAHAAAKRGVTVVLLTDNWQSPAARSASHVLSFPVSSPSIFDVLTVGMALVEALTGAVANRLGDTGRARMASLEDLRKPFAPREPELNRTPQKRDELDDLQEQPE